jgi:hypothetical protein
MVELSQMRSNKSRACVKTHFWTIQSACSFHQSFPYQKFDRYRISLRYFSHSLSPEPTAVGAVSSAVAVHVAGRRWLSFFR